MKRLVEYTVKHGDILINKKDEIHSFGIDDGTIYFWVLHDEDAQDGESQRYMVLDTGDEVDNKTMQHVATLVEGIKPKHIYIEYIVDDKPKAVTKILTDKGFVDEIVEDIDLSDASSKKES
jgi:hypothetical protein